MANQRRIVPRRRRVSAEFVRAWLDYLDVSQNELAVRLGVNPATVSKWVNGTNGISADTTISIAEALDIDDVDLLRWPGALPEVSVFEEREQQLMGQLRRLDAKRRDHALRVMATLLDYEGAAATKALPPPD